MAADLSTYLPDCDEASEHGTLTGMKLMTLATAGASWTAVVRAGDEVYAGEWDFHELIAYDPESSSRPICLEIMEQGNGLRAIVRKVQQILNSQYYMIHGIFGFGAQDVVNATNLFGWELVSASGTAATLRRRAGDPDPNNMTLSVFSLNTEWVPGENTRYIQTTSQIKMPAECLMTLSSGSKLRYHHGWIVKNWQCPDTVGEDDTFTANLRTPIGAAAAQKHDSGDSNDVLAYFELYVPGFRPPWLHVVDEERMFCVETEQTVEAPFGDEIVLESAKRIQWPDGERYWFTATTDGGSDLTNTLMALLEITHVGASGFRTAIDVSGLAETLDGVTSITFTYWVESGNDEAKPCHAPRCANMKRDWSASTYDTTVQDGDERWNCVFSGYCSATRRKDCYDTTGDGFTALETPTKAGDQAMWKQVLAESHFRYRQLVEGFPLFTIETVGCPSAAHLSGLNYEVPTGYHTTMYAFWSGGMNVIDTSGDTVQITKRWRQDWDTLETYGPAGNNVARNAEIGTADEAGFVDKSNLMSVDFDIDPYNVEVAGTAGRYQRVNRAVKLAVCNVTAANVVNYGYGCSLVRQMFDADFLPTTDAEQAVYYGYIEVDRNLDIYNRQGEYATHGGEKLSAKVAAVTDNEDGTYWLELSNGVVAAGSIHPTNPRQELISQWKTTGTNVAGEDSQRVNNWLSWLRFRGPLVHKMARVGNCCKLTDPTFSAKAFGRRFWIVDAEATSGGEDSWKPEDLLTWIGAKLRLPIVIFGDASETVTSVTCTRDSGAVEFTAAQGWPFPLSLAKDVLVWEEFYDGEGQKGFACKFSHLNMTGDEDDRVVALTIETEIDGSPANTYAFTDYDMMLELQGTLYTPGGTDAPQCLVDLDMGSDTIEEVTILVDYTDPATGLLAQAELTDLMATFPTSWSEIGLTHWAKIEATPQNWLIAIPAQYMGSGVKIQVRTDGVILGDEDDYYDGMIAVHSASVRADYADFGRKRDRIKVEGEGLGLLPAAEDMVGKTITVTDDGGVHYSDTGKEPEVHLRKADTSQTELTESDDYVLHGADRRFYLKFPFGDDEAELTVEDGDSFYIKAWVADRRKMMLGADAVNVRKMIENTVEG